MGLNNGEPLSILARAVSRELVEELVGGEEERERSRDNSFSKTCKRAGGKQGGAGRSTEQLQWLQSDQDYSDHLKDLPKERLRKQETHSSSSFLGMLWCKLK